MPHRTLGEWVQAGQLTEPERAEAEGIRELRKEAERLRMENGFLKKAAAFLAANQAWTRSCG